MKKAFTLIELIVFMGIFSGLLLILTNLFITSLDIKSQSESSSALVQDGRFILNKVTNDLNNANSVNYPTLGSSASSLNFILYGTPMSYQLNNGNFESSDGTGTYVLNSSDTKITSLTFTRLGNVGGKNSILINFTLQSKTNLSSGNQVISFDTAIALR